MVEEGVVMIPFNAEEVLEKYACLFCRKPCGKPIHLRQHMDTHSKNKPNICEFCGIGFTQVGNLNKHKVGCKKKLKKKSSSLVKVR